MVQVFGDIKVLDFSDGMLGSIASMVLSDY